MASINQIELYSPPRLGSSASAYVAALLATFKDFVEVLEVGDLQRCSLIRQPTWRSTHVAQRRIHDVLNLGNK